MEDYIERGFDVVNKPDWRASFEDIGKQISEVLSEYKDDGKIIEEIRIIAGKPTEIRWLKVRK